MTLDHLREIALIQISQAQRTNAMIIRNSTKLMGGALTIEERGHHGGSTSVAVIRGPLEFTTSRFTFSGIENEALHAAEAAGTAEALFNHLLDFTKASAGRSSQMPGWHHN